MKILMLMRHAKSTWSDEYPEDFDRPLNKRGLRDAPKMGHLIAERVLTPDCMIASSARRAVDTAAAVASASGYEGSLLVTRELYHAPAETYLELAGRQPEAVQRILLIGHNPGIGRLVETLSGEPTDMPTGALACFDVDLQRWTDLLTAPRTLEAFWRPRET